MGKWYEKMTKAAKAHDLKLLEVVRKVLWFIEAFIHVMLKTISSCFGVLGLLAFGIMGAKEYIFALSLDESYQLLNILCLLATVFCVVVSTFNSDKSFLALAPLAAGAIASVWFCPQLIANMHTIDLEDIITSPIAILLYIQWLSQIALRLSNYFGPAAVWIELPGGIMKKFEGKNRAEASAKADEFTDKYIPKSEKAEWHED